MKQPLEMDVYMDHVEIEKQIVKRPVRVTRSVWLWFWEEFITGVRRTYCPHCGKNIWNG